MRVSGVTEITRMAEPATSRSSHVRRAKYAHDANMSILHGIYGNCKPFLQEIFADFPLFSGLSELCFTDAPPARRVVFPSGSCAFGAVICRSALRLPFTLQKTGGSHMNRPFCAARSFNRQAHGDKPPSLGLLLFPFFPKRTERPRSFDHRRMVQPRVFAARCKELLVCAALADAVLVDDDDLVRMLDR